MNSTACLRAYRVNISLRAEILEHEQEFDLLLALLQQHPLLHMMERFAPSFPEPYHDQIVACYLKIFAAENQ